LKSEIKYYGKSGKMKISISCGATDLLAH